MLGPQRDTTARSPWPNPFSTRIMQNKILKKNDAMQCNCVLCIVCSIIVYSYFGHDYDRDRFSAATGTTFMGHGPRNKWPIYFRFVHYFANSTKKKPTNTYTGEIVLIVFELMRGCAVHSVNPPGKLPSADLCQFGMCRYFFSKSSKHDAGMVACHTEHDGLQQYSIDLFTYFVPIRRWIWLYWITATAELSKWPAGNIYLMQVNPAECEDKWDDSQQRDSVRDIWT